MGQMVGINEVDLGQRECGGSRSLGVGHCSREDPCLIGWNCCREADIKDGDGLDSCLGVIISSCPINSYAWGEDMADWSLSLTPRGAEVWI